MVRKFVTVDRKWLQGVAVFVLAILVVLFLVLREDHDIVLEKWQLALILLLFFLFGGIHMLLMYDAWFVRGGCRLSGLKKVVFFHISLVYTVVLAFLFVIFVCY